MATVAPIVPESLPFDNRSPTGAGCNHIPMNNSNHVPKINAAYSSNTPPLSTMTTNPAQSVTSPPPVTGKRARNSDESDVKAGHASTTEEDGRKKRSRGRPRLDTKDETAADVSHSRGPLSRPLFPLLLGDYYRYISSIISLGISG